MSQNLKLQVVLATADRITKPFKKMVKSSDKLKQAIEGNKKSLQLLNTAQKNLDQFKQLKKGSRDTATALNGAQQKAADLARQFNSTAKPTKKLTAEFERAKRKVNSLKQQQVIERQELQRLGQELRNAGLTTGRLTKAQRELDAKTRKVNKSLNTQSERLLKTQKRQTALNRAHAKYRKGQQVRANMSFTGAAGVATGGTALRGLQRLAQPGINFEAEMDRVGALARLDEQSEAFKLLEKQSSHLGKKTAFTSGQAAQGQAFLAMAGFDPEKIQQSIPHMLNLAQAGGSGEGPLDLGQTADIASNILSAFKLEGKDMGRVSDVLAATFTRSNTSLEMLGETMKYTAPEAAAVKASLEETAAMSGLLGNIGVQATNAGTALRAIYNRMSAPPKAARDALAEIDVKTKDTAGNLRNVPEILAEIARKTEKMGTADRLEAFSAIAGLRFGGKLAELVDQSGAGGIEKFVTILKNSEGEAAKIAQKMLDNTRGDTILMSSAWDGLSQTLTKTNNGALRQTIQSVTNLIGKVQQWSQANPELTASLVKWTAIIAVVITAFGAFTLALASIFGPMAILVLSGRLLGIRFLGLVGIIKKLGGVFLWLGRLLLLNPIGLVITAIAAGAYLVWKNWDWLKGKFAVIWEKIKDISSKGVDYFKSIPGKFMDVGKQIVQGLVDGILSGPKLLEDAAKKVSGVLIGKFKGLLGIHSPSRVFMGFGGNITQGLNIGMLKEQSKSAALAKKIATAGAVAASVGGISVATASPTLSAPGGNISAPVSQNITIHVQAAPGMDEAALARLVAQKLEEINRQNAARERSRLFDNY